MIAASRNAMFRPFSLSRFRRRSLLLAALTACLVSTAEGQVTIRDTVEIGPDPVVGKKPPPPIIVPVGEGTLCAYYDAAWRLGAAIPGTATVSVVNSSILFATDTLTARLPVTSLTNVSACGQGSIAKYTQGPSIPGSTDERWWSIGPVQQEDEIQVNYSRGTAPTVITQQGAAWTAKMGVTCQEHPQVLYQEYVELSFAVVEPDTSLTITPSETTVWPDRLDEGTPGTFSTTFADPFVHEIAVRLFDGCAPIARHEVSVRAEWVYGSGGHLHGTSQDSVPYFGSMGMFTVLSDTTRTALAAITDTTGPDGYLRLSYLAPEFGGSVDIIATAIVATDTLVNAFRLDVRVPNLVAIPDTVGDDLIGGTCNHHGPRGAAEPNFECRTPDDNHYATQATIDKLYAVRSAWKARFPSQPFKINDASLPFGGRFDICGEWSSCTSGHDFHRIGRDVDVRTSRNTLSPGGVLVQTIGTYVENGKTKLIVFNEDFDKEVRGVTGIKPQVHSKGGSNEHYHLYFY